MTDEASQTTEGPNHRWVAEKLGMSISGVSLLRSGSRNPSIETMEKIEETIGWDVCEQVTCRSNYHKKLNVALAEKYRAELAGPMPGQTAIDDPEEEVDERLNGFPDSIWPTEDNDPANDFA